MNGRTLSTGSVVINWKFLRHLLVLNSLVWPENRMETDGNFLATCDRCGKAYAATITDGGEILPLGARNGCRCGGESFSRVDEEDFDDATYHD